MMTVAMMAVVIVVVMLVLVVYVVACVWCLWILGLVSRSPGENWLLHLAFSFKLLVFTLTSVLLALSIFA